jgi:hypothetical protein
MYIISFAGVVKKEVLSLFCITPVLHYIITL